MPIIPTVLEDDKRSWDVFSLLLKNRAIFLTGQVNDEMASVIIAQLLYLESQDPTAEIWLYVNSPGGSVTAGMGIIDTIEYMSAKVNIVVTGMAASMGAMILACGTGKRYVLKNSTVMIHQPLGGAQGQATEILIAAKHIEKTREVLYKIIAEKTGKPYDQVFKDADRDYYMDAQEAVAYGIADEVMTRDKMTSIAQTK